MGIYKFIRSLDKGLVVEIPNSQGLIGVVVDFTIDEDYVKFTAVLQNRGVAVCTYKNDGWEDHIYNVKDISKCIKEKKYTNRDRTI